MPDGEAAAAFETLFERTLATGPNAVVQYDLPWPRWQFVSHIIESHQLVAHGSQNREIEVFEPRKSTDAHPFGDRKAVFGAADGLWAMYYAILDRATHPMLLVNSAVRVERADGSLTDPYYYFAISQSALDNRAFRPGTLYFLPADGFEAMPPMSVTGTRAHVPQRASLEPVVPLARIDVAPEDFPLLDRIRGHDDQIVLARAKADPDGFPWLD